MMKNPFDRKEERAGLYITVIFHLTVIIVLLASRIDSTLRREESFVLDFSKQEEIERIEKEKIFKEEISKRLDELISAAHSSGEPVRNIAVDAGSHLKDDRGTDAEDLYKDAERLANELRNGHTPEDATEETVELPSRRKEEETPKKEYKGPSVLSYSLDGRKASKLPIPAYRCLKGGDVTVIITVNNAGQVVNAKVMDEVSSTDQCLRNFAIRAARLSRFSASSTAPHNQTGEIVYRFIAQ